MGDIHESLASHARLAHPTRQLSRRIAPTRNAAAQRPQPVSAAARLHGHAGSGPAPADDGTITKRQNMRAHLAAVQEIVAAIGGQRTSTPSHSAAAQHRLLRTDGPDVQPHGRRRAWFHRAGPAFPPHRGQDHRRRPQRDMPGVLSALTRPWRPAPGAIRVQAEDSRRDALGPRWSVRRFHSNECELPAERTSHVHLHRRGWRLPGHIATEPSVVRRGSPRP